MLITTSNSAIIPREHRTLICPVGVFSSREALSFLMGRLTADPDQRLGAIDLVDDLGCEPLALAQASGVIASSALSCRDYRSYFVRRRDQSPGGSPSATSVTWTFSVEQAERLAPGASTQDLLAFAALLDGHGIPAAVFTTSAAAGYLAGGAGQGRPDPQRTRGALRALERTGLLAIDLAGPQPAIRMSLVVQAAIRGATPSGLLEQAARAAAEALLEVWAGDDSQTWLAQELRACTASLQRAAGDLLWAGGCHSVLLRAGRSLDSARLTGPAVAYWRELAAVSERLLGPGHPDTMAIGEQLADAYLRAGRAAEAASWFKWVLEDRNRSLGPDHPGTVTARRDLGHALVAAGQPAEAVAVLTETVTGYERVRGTDHLETLGARDELAAAHHAAGQFAQAVQLYRRTLADRERIQGARDPETMTTRQKLADAYLADGRIKDAVSQYKKALADRERVLGPDDLDTIAARGDLASAYHAQGRMASAVQLYEQTSASYLSVLGPDHRDTLACRAKLGQAYYAVGRLTDAAGVLRDTAVRCERVLPADDPLNQAVLDSLANITGG